MTQIVTALRSSAPGDLFPHASTADFPSALALLLGASFAAWAAPDNGSGNGSELAPTGKGIGTINHPNNGNGSAKSSGGARPGTNGISYHGGPVMTNSTTVYYIWYGDWSNNTATMILPDLASHIGGSSYFNINTTYTNGSGAPVKNQVIYNDATSATTVTSQDSAYRGTSLSDSDIQAVVAAVLTRRSLPTNTDAVYFVLTSANVTASSGFCTQYCGWHTHFSYAGQDIKYSFVGNGDRCPSACQAQTTSPNGNAGADGMASVIAHELEEAVTDPDLNAWYDSRGAENADKCAWTFGTTYAAANGSKANMRLGTRDFLIQRNWVNAQGGYCALLYQTGP